MTPDLLWMEAGDHVVLRTAVADASGSYQSGEYVCTCWDTIGGTKARNRRLIAAAPRLLSTLIEIRKWMDPEISGWDAKFCAEVDAVLAELQEPRNGTP